MLLLSACGPSVQYARVRPVATIDTAPFALADSTWPAPDSLGVRVVEIDSFATGHPTRVSLPTGWYRVQAAGGPAWLARLPVGGLVFRFPGRPYPEVLAAYTARFGQPRPDVWPRDPAGGRSTVYWLTDPYVFELGIDSSTTPVTVTGAVFWVLVEGGVVAPVSNFEQCLAGVVQLCPTRDDIMQPR
jgi:hypothetical protein